MVTLLQILILVLQLLPITLLHHYRELRTLRTKIQNPSNTLSPFNLSNTKPSVSHVHQTLPPIPLSFHKTITFQPQPHSSQTQFTATLSSFNPNPPSSFPTSQNSSLNLIPSSSPPPPTSYHPYASLHPGFHDYPPSSFQPPFLPPNLLLLQHTFSIHLLLNLLCHFSKSLLLIFSLLSLVTLNLLMAWITQILLKKRNISIWTSTS